MEKNIGKTDKIIRVVAALVFAYLGYRYSIWWYLITIVMIITVATGHCTPYRFLKINTRGR